MPNKELLKRTMRHIKRYPEKHDQVIWAEVKTVNTKGIPMTCGTAGCFAYRACVLSGAKLGPLKEYQLRNLKIEGVVSLDTIVDKEGKERNLQYYAQDLLGLSDYEAEALFYFNNSIERLEQLVKGFTS